MLDSNHIPKFWTKEKPSREVMIEFYQAEHYNALIDELWCPYHIRKEVAFEPARTMRVIIICETDNMALDTAKYHFCRTGSEFKIINQKPTV